MRNPKSNERYDTLRMHKTPSPSHIANIKSPKAGLDRGGNKPIDSALRPNA